MTDRYVSFGRSLLAGCAVCAVLGAAPAAALQHEQFSVGWPLELPAERGFFDVPLTLEMYQQARRLEELAVIDLGGDPMSFYRVGAAPDVAGERRTPLGASPIHAAEPGAGSELRVQTDGERANVTVTRSPADSEVVGFIVDARAVEPTPFAFELVWRPVSQPFLMEVRVEYSQNLSDWRPVGRGSVAALSIEGAEVRHGRVPVTPPAPGGYYRITRSRNVVDWHLESVVLISAEAERPSQARIARFAPTESPQQPSAASAHDEHVLHFDIGGRLPVTSVTLAFTAANRWAKGRIASSPSPDGPWQARADTRLFYDLDYEGENLLSPVVDLGRVEDRYWRVGLDDAPLTGAIELQFQYPQEYLRFFAGGIAPYMLVAGTLSPAAGPDRTLHAVWEDMRPDRAMPRRATVGPLVELGGAAALEEPFAFPWDVVLWIVLGAGVLAVAAMAIKLVRETSGTH